MLKRCLCAFAASTAAVTAHAAAAVPLQDAAQLAIALSHGALVSVSVDLSRCTPAGNTTAPGTTRGGVKIDAWRLMPDGTLSFADEHASIDSSGKPIWQFIRYRVNTNETVSFTSDLFSLPSYARLTQQVAYTCTINDGIRFLVDR